MVSRRILFLGIVALVALFLAGAAPKAALGAEITVNTTEDEFNDDGDCSLREALRASNVNLAVDACSAGDSTPDTIIVPAGTYELALTGASEDQGFTGDLDIGGDLTISGDGAATTIIDANNIDRVFHVLVETVVISGVTITGGTAPATEDGGGILNAPVGASELTLENTVVSGNTAPGSFGFGGGIYNTGTLHVNSSAITGNDADFGAGISTEGTLNVNLSTISTNTASSEGGGIFAPGSGTATLERSTVSGNNGQLGAGISNHATMNLSRSTVNGNISSGGAGGIYNEGFLTVTDSTVSGNTSSSGGGGILNAAGTLNLDRVTVIGNSSTGACCGGVSGAVAALKSSIISNNTASTINPDCSGTVNSLGIQPNREHYRVHDQAAPPPATSQAPTHSWVRLPTTAGPTQTHRPLFGSIVVDAGDPACAAIDDQRGLPRPFDGDSDATSRCDIGAVEEQPLNLVVDTSLDEPVKHACTPAVNDCSLRGAIDVANAPGWWSTETITFDPATDFVPITLSIPGASENFNASGDLDILDNVQIIGNAPEFTVVDANDTDRVFHVLGGIGGVLLSGVTVTDGAAPSGEDGGGIASLAPGELTLQYSAVTGNTVPAGRGGGIYSSGFVGVDQATISTNTAGDGAGAYIAGNDFFMSRSTVSDNTASGAGGGIHNAAGALTIMTARSVTIAPAPPAADCPLPVAAALSAERLSLTTRRSPQVRTAREELRPRDST